MIEITDKSYQPELEEISEYADFALLNEFFDYMKKEYQPIISIEYSGESAFSGWNVKFKKAGRSLCTVYPRKGHFFMLVVVGQRERPRVEALWPELSGEFRKFYLETREVMNQRWLMPDITERSPLFDDALKIIKIRRQPRPAAEK